MGGGLLSKETHQVFVLLAPPLTIDQALLAWAVDQIREVLEEMENVRKASWAAR
ncbi:MAG: hypothetical protein PVG91_09830 [Gammaproteobacteria bacterium]|jgi:acetylornithine/succinyldiaminopimelate/putrescine aminotransferase